MSQRSFAKHVQDDDGIGFDVVDNAPGVVTVVDPEFVALAAHSWHRARVRKTEHLTLLQAPQEEAGLHTAGFAERRGLYFTVEPDERLVGRSGHGDSTMSNMI